MNPAEIIQVVEATAKEKDIDREKVFEALEEAFARSARNVYGMHTDMLARINRRSGELSLHRSWKVVDKISTEDVGRQLLVEDARRMKPDAAVGDFVFQEIPPAQIGRIATQSARQVIIEKIRDAERERQFNSYKDRIGEIVNGIVKRVGFRDVVVDVGRAEGVIRREDMIPREPMKEGDRVRVLIRDVRRERTGPQIILSRSHPDFLKGLLSMEVPQVYDGTVVVMAVARDPGSRAKVAVMSKDPALDPVGACIGMKGARIQAVSGELRGERIDVFEWSDDPLELATAALTPAPVLRFIVDEDQKTIEAVVPDDKVSGAIGRRGQNVRLAKQITGWTISVVGEEAEANKRETETAKAVAHFTEALMVDEMLAHLLYQEGFSTCNDIADVDPEFMENIDGLENGLGTEVHTRACEWLNLRHAQLVGDARAAGLSDELIDFPGLEADLLPALAKAGIRTVDDLADLATDELLEIVGETTIERPVADRLILSARGIGEAA
jgi:N utilization substance protein A